MQRSEGGALGMGGGGGGFMTGRGTANLLTRITAYLAAGFFFTSIALTLLAQNAGQGRSIFDAAPKAPVTAPAVPGAPAAPALPGSPAPVSATPVAPGAPAATAPATPAVPGAPAPARGGVLDRLGGGAPRLPTGQ